MKFIQKFLGATFVLAAFILVSSSISVPNASADAVFAGAPATPDGKIDPTRTKFDYQVDPAESRTDQVYVANLGTVPLEFLVFASTATSEKDGTYAFADQAQKATDVADWIKFSNGASQIALTLKPKTHQTLGFTLAVPQDASPGDHSGGIVVQAKQKSDGGQISIQGRVATRLYVRVRGDLTPNLTISAIKATYKGYVNPFEGDLTEKYTITNNGNVALSGRITTGAKGLFDLPLSKENTWDIPEITPGTSRDIDITIHGVGQWFFMNASVKLTPLLDSGSIKLKNLQPISRSAAVWVFPTSWVVIFALIGLVVLIVFRLRRNRRLQVARWLEFTEAEAKLRAENSVLE